MYKKVNVVMLPTNEKANKGELYFFDKLLISEGKYCGEISQHLYFTSNDKIKDDDWVLTDKNVIGKVIKISNNGLGVEIKIVRKDNDLEYYPLDCKKIIATTDTSLKFTCECCTNGIINKESCRTCTGGYVGNLPKPSQSFIQKYVEEYNRENIISEVMVEYKKIKTWCNDGKVCVCNNPKFCKENRNGIKHVLKINTDNTINIKPIKDSYSREEVIKLMDKSISRGIQLKTDLQIIHKKDHIDKWIEENL